MTEAGQQDDSPVLEEESDNDMVCTAQPFVFRDLMDNRHVQCLKTVQV
jgi:hypothetical protein